MTSGSAARLNELSAAEALVLLSRGDISAVELVGACLDQLSAEESRVGAWAHLDPALALAEALRIDRLTDPPTLRGLPVGIKDIIDTGNMPTECGARLFRGRQPAADAACVASLRAAGAVILGKTVTTEFAYLLPGKTRNPHNPSHTPGGSSSGSAAAVAARMVPVALGTQTGGSVIRPASFCGVVGFKPTFGLLPLTGVWPFAPSLDTLGLFVRDLADLPLLLGALGAPLPSVAPRSLRLGVCRTLQWSLAAPESQMALVHAVEVLGRSGAEVSEIFFPGEFDDLSTAPRTIMAVEAAESFRFLGVAREAQVGHALAELLDSGRRTPRGRYDAALARAMRARRMMARVFRRIDIVLTPAAIGEAPADLSTTGDGAFNRIWTLLGLPCLTLPGAIGPSGLPVGIQLVGRAGGEAEQIALAAWIRDRLAEASPPET